VTWLRGTLAGRVVYLRAKPLPCGRRLFVERRSGTWRAFSARDYLDHPGTTASAQEAAWCEQAVFVASGGRGAREFDCD
jgi:hypothetical protein